jgi:RNA polymerase sigma-70 factor (ECF subfamily)
MILEILGIAKVPNWLVQPHKKRLVVRPDSDAMAERAPDDQPSLVARLYDAHGAMLYRYALMLLANHAAAEDAVHHVFASMLREGIRSVAVQDERGYLKRAVRNACYSTHRRRVTRAEVDDGEPLLELIPGRAAPVEERLALDRAIRELTFEQREVVHLHVFEGLTFQEIARDVGASINTVASRYRYALARMRAVLK